MGRVTKGPTPIISIMLRATAVGRPRRRVSAEWARVGPGVWAGWDMEAGWGAAGGCTDCTLAMRCER